MPVHWKGKERVSFLKARRSRIQKSPYFHTKRDELRRRTVPTGENPTH